MAFPVNRKIKILLVRSRVFSMEENDISVKSELQEKEKTSTSAAACSLVNLSLQENSVLLIRVKKGLRTNICSWFDIVSWLIYNMMDIEKTVAYTII